MTPVSNGIDRFVGMRLRLQREKLRISRAQFAEHLGIAERSLADYENGAVRLSAQLLREACLRLGVAPSYFFTGMTLVPPATTVESADADPEQREAARDVDTTGDVGAD